MATSSRSPVVGVDLSDKTPRKYEMDTLESPDDEDTYHGVLKARNDAIDMQRMGKTQELRVS
jgi:hypothetical protein